MYLYYVHMAKRMTIAIDEQLLERAKRALGGLTTRATVEEALRRVAESAEDERAERGGARPFVVESRPLGLRPGIDLTKALRMAYDLEDEEIIRKLKLGK
jgi:Arc/MetJ family transcription regulator